MQEGNGEKQECRNREEYQGSIIHMRGACAGHERLGRAHQCGSFEQLQHEEEMGVGSTVSGAPHHVGEAECAKKKGQKVTQK